MTKFDFIVDNTCPPRVHNPKRTLKLQVTEDGFNLTDQKGYCIINASLIKETGEFGVNQGEVGNVTVDEGTESSWGSPSQPRTDYRIGSN